RRTQCAANAKDCCTTGKDHCSSGHNGCSKRKAKAMLHQNQPPMPSFAERQARTTAGETEEEDLSSDGGAEVLDPCAGKACGDPCFACQNGPCLDLAMACDGNGMCGGTAACESRTGSEACADNAYCFLRCSRRVGLRSPKV